jgi:oxalate---CoA ligase
MRSLLLPQLRQYYHTQPHKVALHVPNLGTLTYEHLLNNTNKWMSELLSINIPIEARIGIFDINPLDLAGLGCAIVNQFTFVGIDHNMGVEAILDYIELMHIDLVITQTQEGIISQLIGSSHCGWYQINSKQQSIVCIKEHEIKPFSNRTDIVGMIKTSGTTSTPKVIAVSEAMLQSQFDQYYSHFEVSTEDIFAQPVNMSRPIAFLLQSMRVWRWGCTLVYVADLSLNQIMQAIIDTNITRYTAPTFMIHAMNEYVKTHNFKLNHSLILTNLGSTLHPIHVSALQSNPLIKLVNSYGMSETGLLASTYAQPNEDIFSIGIDMGVGITLINDEICIKYPNYFEGYENVDSTSSFTKGYFRTGDLAFLDDSLNYQLIGRVSEMINRGGDKISPYEVEAKLSENFELTDVAVFPIPSIRWTQEVGCVVVTNEDLTLPMIRETLKPHLSSFKMPTSLYRLDTIPRSSNGKIVRSSLHQYCTQEHQIIAKSQKSSMTPVQEIIHDVWCEVLQVENIGKDADFISWGGDSFRFAQIVASLQHKLSLSLDISLMSEANTIEKQSEVILQSQSMNWGVLNQYKKGNPSNPTIIFFHDVAGNCEAYTYMLMRDFNEYPVYGVNMTLDLLESLDNISLQETVNAYARLIKAKGFNEVYVGGISSGGIFAYECARLLSQDMIVKGVFMFDTFVTLDQRFKTKSGRLKSLIRKHMRNLRKTSWINNIYQLPTLTFKAVKRWIDLQFYEPQRQASLNQFISSKKGKITTEHIPLLIRHLVNGWIPSQSSFDVIYFYAKQETNPHRSYQRIEPKVKSLTLIEENTHHSGFVSEALAHQSVAKLMEIIQKKTCE